LETVQELDIVTELYAVYRRPNYQWSQWPTDLRIFKMHFLANCSVQQLTCTVAAHDRFANWWIRNSIRLRKT